jgi:HlyD family secretion protein
VSTAPKAQVPARGMKWKWLAIALAILLIAGAADWLYHANSRKAAADQAESRSAADRDDASAVPVETVRLSPGGILRTSTQIGTVHPYKQAELFAKISGYLKELHVDYGDHVKQGQLLAEIDDPEIVKEAEKAAADVNQAKAAVTQAEAFIESSKADREAAAFGVEQAEFEVNRYISMRSYHEKKLTRYKELVKNNAVPQQIADEEEESYESAKASEMGSRKAVLTAKAQLLAAAARVKKSEADLVEAKAMVQVAEAKRDKADVLVGYTRITSPYDGVITKRTFFPGAFIRSAAEGGVESLLTVARTDKVRVVTQIPDRDVPFADVGDPAEITLDALGAEVFHGKVSRFADAEDPTSRTMHTEIDLDNAKDRFKPGMYGIAKVILDKDTKSATLPAKCLVGESRGNKADLYVIKDGKAKKTQVTIGADDGIRVEILSGLDPSDEVILSTGSVSDGAPVRSSAGKDEPKRSQ